MFREMRRKGQLLSHQESLDILANKTAGVLALLGDDGYPYAVPISYVYDQSRIYFHSAKEGHKVDAIRKCAKASFCVIDQDNVVSEEYTTYYKSVIAFGTVRVLEDEMEIRKAIEKLAVKYYPEDCEVNRDRTIDRAWNSLCVIEFSIEHLTGKEAKELVKV